MNKKLWIVILIVIIVIGIGFFAFNNYSSSKNLVQVGSTNFTLPDGYVEGIPNQVGAVNITNGKYSIFIVEYNGTDVNKIINDYELFVKNQNQTMNINNITIDNVLIYKTDNVDNPNTVHYWFVKNKKAYDVYKWDNNPDIDSIVIGLVKSI